jgi:alpha-glucosidase
MILGPMDYTPGGFRNRTPDSFQPRNHAPEVMTTRGQAVAMYVVYDSPFMMVSDSPSAYKNPDGSWTDGADFVSRVPTSWDETRVLAGEIGQYIVTARRKGDVWYIGAMTNEQGRTLDVPLDMLSGRAQADILEDGADPTHLKARQADVTPSDHLTLTLAPSGGAVAVITPVAATGKKRK